MNAAGQNETFLNWVENHHGILRKIARIYAPPDEHPSLYQDLLIAVWQAVPLYRGQSKASTFIYRVCLNRAMNWTRARTAHRNRYSPLDESVADLARGDAAGEDRAEQLYAAIGSLSEADRSLALMYLDDLSYREMGDVLGITETNVGVKLNRMKKRLSEALLKKRGPNE